jgi:hypothetical protein
MKIIDEKGRLFSKINIIDFLLILFLFFLAPMFYFGYQLFTRKPSFQGEVIQQEIYCKFIKLTPEQIKYIAVGDKEFDENGKIIGEIISLDKIEPYIFELTIGSAGRWFKEDPILKQAEAKLRLNVNNRSGSLYYKNSLLSDNADFEFKTDKYRVFAVHRYNELEKRMLDVDVVIKDLDDNTAKLISAGDKEEDDNGNIFAEILRISELEQSSIKFDLGDGNFSQGEDAKKKQLSAKMRLKCSIRGNQIYYKERQLRHDLPFEFVTDKYRAVAVLGKTFKEPTRIVQKWLKLNVKFMGIIPEVAKTIQEGDAEKTMLNEVVARINSIISNKPSEVLGLRESNFILLQHPFNRDLIISLDVLCVEKDGLLHFKNYPVKIGNNITFNSDLYSITGTIINLEIS